MPTKGSFLVARGLEAKPTCGAALERFSRLLRVGLLISPEVEPVIDRALVSSAPSAVRFESSAVTRSGRRPTTGRA